MHVLWRGNWQTRTRIATGLVLFTYVLTHFVIIGLGLFSSDWMHIAQDARQIVTRSLPGTVLLYGALTTHAALALIKLAGRRTLRMPVWLALQYALGLTIPLLLAAHIVFTRVAHEQFGVNDDMGFTALLLWGNSGAVKQGLLLLVVWVHACMGLHYWLRLTRWWRVAVPFMSGLAVLVPAFALAGFMTEGRRVRAAFAEAETQAALLQAWNWPDTVVFDTLRSLSDAAWYAVLALLAAVALVHVGRRLLAARRSVRIRYVDGPELAAPIGMTLLEMSRAGGVPHTALCGGRGRCTTCRVVVEQGADLLHPPSAAEQQSLRAVKAPPGSRLACQIRPTDPSTVFRVFRPDGRRGRAHASQGQERRLALLFLDMRSFTALTTGQLPYDVVFLLNRFFDAIVPAITAAGGTVDKYLGDGLLAVFETTDSTGSARAALRAAAGVGTALDAFNRTLADEGGPHIRIGMGLHLGNLVLGEIGAAGTSSRTIIGDTVNTASRLEGQTKELGVQLLVSEPLLTCAGFDTTALDLIALDLRGVTAPLSALPVADAAQIDRILAAARIAEPT